MSNHELCECIYGPLAAGCIVHLTIVLFKFVLFYVVIVFSALAPSAVQNISIHKDGRY